MGERLDLPDWREDQGYRALQHAAPEAFAWEWLRRDPGYGAAARPALSPELSMRGRAGHGPIDLAGSLPHHTGRGDAAGPVIAPGDMGWPRVVQGDPAAGRWGLHAFADPWLPAGAARPVWRCDWLARVLTVDARPGGPAGERFDLARLARFATVVRAACGSEHVLLSDGRAGLRLDVMSGSLLAGPVCLSYRLSGLAGLRAPLCALRDLVRLCQAGRLPPPGASDRARRLILMLRAWDGLRQGASQREIALVLLGSEAGAARWRTEAPSLRTRAQRLVKGARAMANGGWRGLLGR